MPDQMYRGDSRQWLLTVTDNEDAALNLTGHRVTVTYAKKPDTDHLFQHFIEFDGDGDVVASSGMELQGDIEDGVIVETLTPAESEAFAAGKYGGDMEVRQGDAVVKTIALDELVVVKDYTLPPE